MAAASAVEEEPTFLSPSRAPMDDDPVLTLMTITEKTAPKCRTALQMAQGDLERAMSLLLDGVVDAMGDAADFATSFQPEPAAPAPARAALSPPALPTFNRGGGATRITGAHRRWPKPATTACYPETLAWAPAPCLSGSPRK